MADSAVDPKRAIPEAFNQYRRDAFERTVRLTEKAIAKLKAADTPVTLAKVCEATREFDEHGKGLQPVTILRNPQAAELFHQHSPAYQERHRKTQKAKRKRAKTRTSSEARLAYRGLRAPDLIQIAEELRAQIIQLKTLQEKSRSERDEAYRCRDEALEQNAKLLAALTVRDQRPMAKP
jgi:hypothetical protein